jgi:hypothetical protein
MRARMLTVSLLVAGALTAGCGGDGGDGEQDDAERVTTAEFCEAYNSFYDSFDTGEAPSDSESVRLIQDWADEMESTGTPEDIPDEARDGFEVVLETIDNIPGDATEDDVAKLSEDITEAEQDASQAFGEWATETCPMELPETPGEDESSAP